MAVEGGASGGGRWQVWVDKDRHDGDWRREGGLCNTVAIAVKVTCIRSRA